MYDNILSKTPDVYFDWYARFIPGSIAIIFYFILTNNHFESTTPNLILYAFLSYLLGHIAQPISGFFVKKIENFIDKDLKNKYKLAKQDNKLLNLTNKVSKAHAEATGMFSSFLLTLIIILYYRKFDVIYCLIDILFFVMAIERIYARKRKIKDIVM